MKKKLLVITAHPDDESFGPAGTIALYAKKGVAVHVVCATRGEAGEQDESVKLNVKHEGLHTIREQELLRASQVLGVQQVDFLDFIDGTLNNQQYHLVADKIIEKCKSFKPQVVMTYEPRGVSGHLDHVAISFITTYAYFQSKIPKKLYYYALPEKFTKQTLQLLKKYFVYFPPGYSQSDITTRIDVEGVWKQRIAAIKEHKSQWKDAVRILAILKLRKMYTEHFIRYDSRVKTNDTETDLFEGISR